MKLPGTLEKTDKALGLFCALVIIFQGLFLFFLLLETFNGDLRLAVPEVMFLILNIFFFIFGLSALFQKGPFVRLYYYNPFHKNFTLHPDYDFKVYTLVLFLLAFSTLLILSEHIFDRLQTGRIGNWLYWITYIGFAIFLIKSRLNIK
ncbi:MAG: hypothetical protein FWC91_01960 [Defluviitaleaceae bacterium]|nr:hypothetical protein [Defluviitaleaceae bacterium]